MIRISDDVASLALTVRMVEDSDELVLDEAAAVFFGADSRIDRDRFVQSGPRLSGSNSSQHLGAWIYERLDSSAHEALHGVICVDDSAFIALTSDGEATLFAVGRSGDVRSSNAAPDRHAFRNCINAIAMNAELIDLLASKSGNTQIQECAARIAEECRKSLDALSMN